MSALAQPFPPPVSLSSWHCTVLAGSKPKWGHFRVIFRYFHGRMERIFISHFSFSTTEKTQFSITRRHTCTDTHTHKTQTSTSFADKNDWVKLVSASSDFLNLLPTDSIPLQRPGYYLDNRSSGKHCTVMHIARYTLYAILESACTVHFETKQYE